MRAMRRSSGADLPGGPMKTSPLMTSIVSPGSRDQALDVIIAGGHGFFKNDDIEAMGFEEGVEVFEDEDAVAIVGPREGNGSGRGSTCALIFCDDGTEILGESCEGDLIMTVRTDEGSEVVTIGRDNTVGNELGVIS